MYMVASTDLGFTIWLLFEKLLKGEGPSRYMPLKYLLYVTNKYVFFPTFCEEMTYLYKYAGRYSIALSMLCRLES